MNPQSFSRTLFDADAATSLLLGSFEQHERVLECSPIHQGQEATAYDAMAQRHAWLFIRPFVRMVSQLGLTQGRVLDLGSGPGWIPIELARRHPAWEIH